MLDRPLEHNSSAAIHLHSYIFRNPPPPPPPADYGPLPNGSTHRAPHRVVYCIQYKKKVPMFSPFRIPYADGYYWKTFRQLQQPPVEARVRNVTRERK